MLHPAVRKGILWKSVSGGQDNTRQHGHRGLNQAALQKQLEDLRLESFNLSSCPWRHVRNIQHLPLLSLNPRLPSCTPLSARGRTYRSCSFVAARSRTLQAQVHGALVQLIENRRCPAVRGLARYLGCCQGI